MFGSKKKIEGPNQNRQSYIICVWKSVYLRIGCKILRVI